MGIMEKIPSKTSLVKLVLKSSMGRQKKKSNPCLTLVDMQVNTRCYMCCRDEF